MLSFLLLFFFLSPSPFSLFTIFRLMIALLFSYHLPVACNGIGKLFFNYFKEIVHLSLKVICLFLAVLFSARYCYIRYCPFSSFSFTRQYKIKPPILSLRAMKKYHLDKLRFNKKVVYPVQHHPNIRARRAVGSSISVHS